MATQTGKPDIPAPVALCLLPNGVMSSQKVLLPGPFLRGPSHTSSLPPSSGDLALISRNWLQEP